MTKRRSFLAGVFLVESCSRDCSLPVSQDKWVHMEIHHPEYTAICACFVYIYTHTYLNNIYKQIPPYTWATSVWTKSWQCLIASSRGDIHVYIHIHAPTFPVFPAKDREPYMPCAFEQQGTGISIMLGLDRPERGKDIKQSRLDCLGRRKNL